MRRAEVYRNGILAGHLSETEEGAYNFTYASGYFNDQSMPPISLTLPKTQQSYHSEFLFPFFFNMLTEGSTRILQSRQWKIDEKDFFGLLLATAGYDTIGAVTVMRIDDIQSNGN